MHILTGSCVLLLWTCTLTFVKSQECTREKFIKSSLYDSNFDVSGLDDQYPAGKLVRVNCNIGYSGYFRIMCVEGNWLPKGTKCEPKQCGHPGDAQFADFRLEQGDDFVFGSKVVYTCHKGYQMISRRNFRTCMADGWDGVVPVCEASQCPPIPVGNNVQVFGDTDEATFGNVVRFSCKSSKEILEGPKEVYCDETGQWSGQPPTCTAVKCKVPMISNGFVSENKQEYYEDEVLPFDCNDKYKPSEDRPSRCLKTGQRADWSPTPGCELIKCKLKLPPLEGTSYTPEYTNLFLPGDSVTVRCGDRYGITDRQVETADVLCKKDGEWEIQPVCREVICLKQAPHVYSWSNYWKAQIYNTVNYYCESGYKKPDGFTRATCTRGGWRPDPLCEEIRCPLHEIPNTDLINRQQQYTDGQRANYVCKNGFKGTFSLTCTENGWSGNKQCVEITCDNRVDPYADIESPKLGSRYKHNDQLHYICKKDQQRYTVTCGENGWDVTSGHSCPASTCNRHNDPAADIINPKSAYNYGEQAEYVCKKGGQRYTLTCTKGGWDGESKCSAIKCPKAEVPNGFVVGPFNDTVYYSCNEGFKPLRRGWWGEAKCNGKEWVGLHQCIVKTGCQPPEIPNAQVTPGVPVTGFYADKRRIRITCDADYTSEIKELTCQNGKWNKILKDICKPNKFCQAPPRVENAAVRGPYVKEYRPGSIITYECRKDYTQEGQNTVECENGQWKEPETKMKCKGPSAPPRVCDWGGRRRKQVCGGAEPQLDAGLSALLPAMRSSVTLLLLQLWGNLAISVSQQDCPVPPVIPHASVTEESKKSQYHQGDVIYYGCETGYTSGPSIKYVCSTEGWFAIRKGKCTLKLCQLPEEIPNGRYDFVRGDEFVFGAVIQYHCEEGYQMMSKVTTRTCMLNGWSNRAPVCEPLSCDSPKAEEGLTIKGLLDNDEPITPGRILLFSCDVEGKRLNSSALLMCGNNGQWDHPFPSCEDVACKVDALTPNLRATGLPEANNTVKAGHKLGFSCDKGYTISGSATSQCLESGEWSHPFPTCHVFVPRGPCPPPPHVTDGDIQGTIKRSYAHNERVTYVCPAFYKIENDQSVKTCTDGQWKGAVRCLRPCTVNRDAMNLHKIKFKWVEDDKLYSTPFDHITFVCLDGATHDGRGEMRQQCVDGVMNLPTCISKQTAVLTNSGQINMYFSFVLLFLLCRNVELSVSQNACSVLPDVPHARVSDSSKKAEYPEGHVIHFTCESGFTSDQTPRYVCSSGGWLKVRSGSCYSCASLPRVPHASVSQATNKPEYHMGDVIHFTCESGYTSSLTITYVCLSDGWLPVHQEMCYSPASRCERPPEDRGVRVTGLPGNNQLMFPDHILTFSCDDGKQLTDSSVLICGKDGQWSSSFPTCKDRLPPHHCPPPPHVADGDIQGTVKRSYAPNERVTYVCPAYYKMENDQNVKTCMDGRWVGSVRCLRPCTVNRDAMNLHKIKIKWVDDDKLYMTHFDHITFKCLDGTTHDGRLQMRPQCVDGVVNLPTCIDTAFSCSCCAWRCFPTSTSSWIFMMRLFNVWLFILWLNVDESLQQGEIICLKQAPHVRRWSEPWRRAVIHDMVDYYCESGYKKPHGVTRATCTRGGWSPDPLCEGADTSCTAPPKVENAFVSTPYQKNYLSGSQVTYQCHHGLKVKGDGTIRCQNGVWEQKDISCTRADTSCTAPPKVENAFISTPYQKNYLSGSQVTYQCHHGLKVKGDGTIRCQNGVWEQKDISCTLLEGADCGSPPPLPDGDVRYSIRSQYNHSEQVEYMCQTYYTMEGEPYRTCEDGEWTGHMRCLKPCILNDDDIRQNNISVKSSYNRFLLHDDVVEFRCSTGKPAGSLAMRQRCNSGELSLPSCS
ncbi:complement factor H-like [Betta splendens]|uniref:Complement factor H-like n=1 Tax=Betta splendens TaxID=158456 RepID=A0A9W2XSC9_BETSP|nr:complement factor H-like [Betta splendens]